MDLRKTAGLERLGPPVLRFVGVLFCSTLLVSSAFAQGASDEEEPAATTYDFEDDLVTGDLVRPDGERLMARRRSGTDSLIRIREHFIPEMLKSVEDL